MFFAALTYHPDIGTFRGRRGAWRVHHSGPRHAWYAPRVWLITLDDDEPPQKHLYITTRRRLATGTFVNPAAMALPKEV